MFKRGAFLISREELFEREAMSRRIFRSRAVGKRMPKGISPTAIYLKDLPTAASPEEKRARQTAQQPEVRFHQ